MAIKPHTEIKLAKIIALCLDADSLKADYGWNLLFERYNKQIYNNLWKRCHGFREKNLAELINDFSSKVWVIVKKELPKFRNIDNERSFQGWLKIIANNEVNGYLRKKVSEETVLSLDDLETEPLRPNSDLNTREHYDELVSRVRATSKARNSNMERDIQIFFLEEIRGIDPDSVYDHPGIGRFVKHRASSPNKYEEQPEKKRGYIQRISGRIREKLRKSQ